MTLTSCSTNYLLLFLFSITTLGCSSSQKVSVSQATPVPSSVQSASQPQTEQNSLLAPWTGPYGGVPAFEKMNVADLREAIEKGISQHLTEIEAIANNPLAPTFENTIEAMEKAGKLLKRTMVYYGIWSSNLSTPEFRQIQAAIAPQLAQYRSKISQNKNLFERIKVIFDQANKHPLPADQQRVVSLIYEEFVMEGASLDEQAKQRYAAINEELSTLYTSYANNVLADEEKYTTYLTEEQLGGLPQSFINAAAKAASERGQTGKYAVTNTRSSIDQFLTYSNQRDLREKVWTIFYSRADNGDENDNNANISKILQLRQERVKLLGYTNFAQWRLQDRMAKTPEQAMELMMAVWPAALARVKEEVADMQKIANTEKTKITIAPWDYRYYAEKVRKQKYDLDSDEVKQYLELNNLTEAIFFTAGELFNFEFKPVAPGSVPVFHEDVKVWEVSDKTSGNHIGLWYLDPFARAGKRSGAWASPYRSHTSFDGKETVLASNNSNFIKPAPNEPVLISWDDAITFFHEFGHALHFLSSQVNYPTLNSGVRDYTEFHSQLLERWLSTDKVINQFLRHHKTGKAMPAELVAKIRKAATFNQGFKTTEFLASAIMDMKFHLADAQQLDADKFESETLAQLEMPKEIVMRHRSPHFTHVFSGEGYATGYYGYLWADVLTSDAAEAFSEAQNGFYDKEVAARLVKYLFAPRNAIDPAEAYRKFRGRDAKIDALMRERGFPLPEQKAK